MRESMIHIVTLIVVIDYNASLLRFFISILIAPLLCFL